LEVAVDFFTETSGHPFYTLMNWELLQINFLPYLAPVRSVQLQKPLKIWSSDYFSLLQVRSNWRFDTPNIKVVSIVLLKEDNIPPLKWQLGCIQHTIT